MTIEEVVSIITTSTMNSSGTWSWRAANGQPKKTSLLFDNIRRLRNNNEDKHYGSIFKIVRSPSWFWV